MARAAGAGGWALRGGWDRSSPAGEPNKLAGWNEWNEALLACSPAARLLPLPQNRTGNKLKLTRCCSCPPARLLSLPVPSARQFEVPYDVLVAAQGEQPATFGVPGVDKYCYFMKEVGGSSLLFYKHMCSSAGREVLLDKDCYFMKEVGGSSWLFYKHICCSAGREALLGKYCHFMKEVGREQLAFL